MRYVKQEKVIGKVAQDSLTKKHVLVVGMGALGSVVAESLVRMGIGMLSIVDGDLVETGNLHRQQLYAEQDANDEIPKVYAAKKMLETINSTCRIISHFEELTEQNAHALLKEVDLVIDGTDNLTTRYLINEVGVELGIPWVYGAASGTVGSYFTFIPKKTPCFSCIFGEQSDTVGLNCSTEGVLPVITQYIATMQSNEAIKYLTGNEQLLNKQLEQIDMWHNQTLKMTVNKQAHCFCQQPKKKARTEAKAEPFHLKVLCGKEVIMARLRSKEVAGSPFNWLCQKLDEKNIPYETTPYFQTAIIQKTKVRLFQDGRIYFYHTNKEQVKDILYYWVN